jgi:hypothetical protein
VTPAFPLCCEPRHEPALRSLLEACVDFVRQRLAPPTLVGVVLIGSFARGEGSVLSLPGGLRVLGDIEFFVVLATGADYQRLRAEMATWGPAAAATIGRDHIHVDIEFGPVDVGYFRRARPSIFVHDLRHHGKVLWGPADLLEAIPRFDVGAVPPEDALRLLFNRTIEQLETYDRIADVDGGALLDIAYRRLKVVLDLAGSALAFSGRHCASYGRRPVALARLVAETPSLARRIPEGFDRQLAHAARVKLAPDEYDFARVVGETTQAQRATLRAQIVADVPAMTGLLAWELEQFLGTRGDLVRLLRLYVRTPSLARRAWDWAKLLLNPLRAPVPLGALASPPLVWRSTPRALLYAAGALAYADLAARRPDPDAVARFLPLARRARPLDPQAQRRAVVALWRWCVRNS